MRNKLKLANRALIILNLAGIYIILSVGLKVFPKVSISWSKLFVSNINSVLLSISYSFLAATIFYLLINYLPRLEKKKRFQPVVKRDIDKIHSMFIRMINAMASQTEKYEEIPDYEQFKALMATTSPDQKYPHTQGLITEASFLKTFLYLKAESKEIISHIHLFKEYVPVEIISLLEDLNSSRFFKEVVFLNSVNRLSNKNMEIFAEGFYDGFEIIEKLKTESDQLYN